MLVLAIMLLGSGLGVVSLHRSFVSIPQQPIKKLPLPLSSVLRYWPGESCGGLLPRGNMSAIGRLGK